MVYGGCDDVASAKRSCHMMRLSGKSEIRMAKSDWERLAWFKSLEKQEMYGSRGFACPCGRDAIS